MAVITPIVNDHVVINGHRIACGVHGPQSGTPIVLIHGTPSSSLIFRNVLPYLTATNFKVHVFDLLGFGLSERPWDPNVDTSMTAQVPILTTLMDHWGLDTAHIVAHDIGGGIAQRFAALEGRERVRTLTLVDCVSFDSYPSKRTREQMGNGLETLMKVDDATHRDHFRSWLLSAVYHKDRFTSSSLDTFVDYISGPIGQASLFNHQVRHYDPKHTMEVIDKLGEVGKAMPVKLIWGQEDEWQVTEWARKLEEAITGSELTILEECGHFSPEDQPERIAELVIEFIEKHGRRD
ncbi:alpha/beta hydrolase fold domain-containing protein [Sarocladium implicatum]|nr:alpha/beta hydrolase fold domain-containing protein [Sarocladium implicatum]